MNKDDRIYNSIQLYYRKMYINLIKNYIKTLRKTYKIKRKDLYLHKCSPKDEYLFVQFFDIKYQMNSHDCLDIYGGSASFNNSLWYLNQQSIKIILDEKSSQQKNGE